MVPSQMEIMCLSKAKRTLLGPDLGLKESKVIKISTVEEILKQIHKNQF